MVSRSTVYYNMVYFDMVSYSMVDDSMKTKILHAGARAQDDEMPETIISRSLC